MTDSFMKLLKNNLCIHEAEQVKEGQIQRSVHPDIPQ